MPSTTATAPRPKAWIIATVATSCLAVAGIVAAAVLGLRGPAQADPSTSPAPASAAASGQQYQPNQPNTGHQGSSTASHSSTTPPAAPSASVKLLQQQLAQLNYYNGPITGYENTGTINAIKYLQRDAHLQQTGQLNNATRSALSSMMVHGNNQMAG
ncbi:peptidoglycan-binding domain-containing protein [Kribbella sp. CA-247076]|uniref:peptidoglycan-binding domain-containing protein n=1 Tax=Kribbella sp. CA-247076 TaxID=3239941 RepID=UPI003D9473FD